MEKTLVMLKPNTFRMNIAGEVIHRMERSKFKILAMKLFRFDADLAGKFYAEHVAKPFFPSLQAFMTSGLTLAMVLEAPEAIKNMRKLVGATDPAKADPGTIRFDYAPNATENIVHASDSPASAEREMKLLFRDGEILG